MLEPTVECSGKASTKPHLLTIPPEIRDSILKLVIPYRENITLSGNKFAASVGTRALVALTQTCRQLYAEVLPIYYSKNRFQCMYIGWSRFSCLSKLSAMRLTEDRSAKVLGGDR